MSMMMLLACERAKKMFIIPLESKKVHLDLANGDRRISHRPSL